MSPQTDLGRYWQNHFAARHACSLQDGTARSLDYSNEMVRLQTYSAMLEGAGPLQGKTVWDVGCGWGSLSLLFHASGARVLGSDIVAETIGQLRREQPGLEWKVLDAASPAAVDEMPAFDIVAACEALQYTDAPQVMRSLWRHVKPGGRLVGCIPNRECPIITRVSARNMGLYVPMSGPEVRHVAATLPDLHACRLKGLVFREDQSFLPYFATDWDASPPGVPNRIVFTMLRH